MRETLYGRQPVRESLRAGRRTPFRLLMAKGIVSTPIIDEIIDTGKPETCANLRSIP